MHAAHRQATPPGPAPRPASSPSAGGILRLGPHQNWSAQPLRPCVVTALSSPLPVRLSLPGPAAGARLGEGCQ